MRTPWPDERGTVNSLLGIGSLAVLVALLPMSAAASDSGDPTRGRKIFVKYCSGCHGSQGQGDGYPLLGPSPANLLSPSTKERSSDELLRTIHEGKPNMPAWKYRLSLKDSDDVLAYVRTLQAERPE
jgi:mono/diheme cytochrome c family protein